MVLTFMAFTRNRSRFKTTVKNPSTMTLFPSTVVKQGNYAGYTEFEAMTDRTTIGWPRIEISDTGSSTFPTRLGFPHGTPAKRSSIIVNNMTYSCVTEVEASSTMIFSSLPAAPVWVTLNGSCCQLLSIFCNSTWPSPSVPVIPSLATLSFQAQSDLLSKARDPQYSFGEPIAEIRKTLATIRNPLSALRRMSASFFSRYQRVRQNARTAREVSRAFASTYAEYQFALAPAMRDVQNGIDAYVGYASRDLFRTKFKRLASTRSASGYATSFLKDNAWKFPPPISQNTIFCDKEATYTIERQVTAGLHKALPDETSRREYLGLSARDIPELMWDLFPYSFLIDRLINVKKFIRTANSLLSGNATFSGGWISTRQTIRQSKRFTRFTRNIGFRTNPDASPPWITTTFLYERNKWDPTHTPIPPPEKGRGLLETLKTATDLVSVIILRFTALPYNSKDPFLRRPSRR